MPVRSRATRSLFPALLLAVALSACGEGSYDGALSGVDFAPELGVNLAAMTVTDSGLHYVDEQAGQGDPAEAGRGAVVHYSGWLPDGTAFDSSHQRGEPFALPMIGAGMVIEGWDEGLQGMRPGGTRLLVIPPSLGYGEQGVPGVIPPNSVLVFRVEMLDHLDMAF